MAMNTDKGFNTGKLSKLNDDMLEHVIGGTNPVPLASTDDVVWEKREKRTHLNALCPGCGGQNTIEYCYGKANGRIVYQERCTACIWQTQPMMIG